MTGSRLPESCAGTSLGRLDFLSRYQISLLNPLSLIRTEKDIKRVLKLALNLGRYEKVCTTTHIQVCMESATGMQPVAIRFWEVPGLVSLAIQGVQVGRDKVADADERH